MDGLLPACCRSVRPDLAAGVDAGQDHRDHRPADAVCRLPHPRRAQDHRLHAGSHRPQPGRSARTAAAIADGVKLLLKEVIVPRVRARASSSVGPILALAPVLAAWAVVPFSDGMVLANVDAGLLFLLAITSLEVYGVIVAGWASNSKGPLRRRHACRRADGVLRDLDGLRTGLRADDLGEPEPQRHRDAAGQGRFADMGVGFLSWNWLPLFPMFIVFMVSGIAETNRAPSTWSKASRDRRRPHGRILGHGLRAVLPR